jgi:uncharacterized membrane protein YwaF
MTQQAKKSLSSVLQPQITDLMAKLFYFRHEVEFIQVIFIIVNGNLKVHHIGGVKMHQ